MLSIGGITYTDAWNQALAQNADPARPEGGRARHAARRRHRDRLRGEHQPEPHRPAGVHQRLPGRPPVRRDRRRPAARLTIDLAAGDRWLIGINQKATADWLRTDRPVLDYANAMVPARQPSASTRRGELAGAHRRQAPVQPAGPAARAGEVHRLPVPRRGLAGPAGVHQLRRLGAEGDRPITSSASLPKRPAGTHAGHARVHVLGGRAAVDPRRRRPQPPNTCEGGIGVGATTLNMPLPMPALRQN